MKSKTFIAIITILIITNIITAGYKLVRYRMMLTDQGEMVLKLNNKEICRGGNIDVGKDTYVSFKFSPLVRPTTTQEIANIFTN